MRGLWPLWGVLACSVPQEALPTLALTETSSGTGSTGVAAVDSSSGDAAETVAPPDLSTSTGAAPSCGDGQLDDGEECDDGNAVDGDGCNADCLPSGSIGFEFVFDDNPLGDEEILDIAQAVDGTHILTGYIAGADKDVWAARLDAEDAILWDRPLIVGSFSDVGWAAAATDTGTAFIAGETSGSKFVMHVDDTGAQLGEITDPDVFDGRWLAAEPVDDGFVVVGDQTEPGAVHGVVRLYTPALAAENEIEPVLPELSVNWTGVCRSSEEELLVVGHLRRYTGSWEATTALLDGAKTVWIAPTPATSPQQSYGAGCAAAGEGADRLFWIAGYLSTDTQRFVATLRSRTPSGQVDTATPNYTGEIDQGASFSDLGIDGAGNIIAVGADLLGSMDDEWKPLVRKHAPNGTVLWTRVWEPAGYPRGTAYAVSVTPAGDIRVVGNATTAANERRRYIARFTP